MRTDNEWLAALQAQNNAQKENEYAAIENEQRGVSDEMGELMTRTQRENAKKQLDFNNVISSAIKYSQGGVLPEVLRGYINRRYGWDGQTSGVLQGSGFQQNGEYVFRLANGVDNQGRVTTQNIAFGQPQIFQMMQTNRTAFNDNDRAAMRRSLLQSGLSTREVAQMEFNPFQSTRPTSTWRNDPDYIKNRVRLGAGGRQIGDGVTFKGADTRPRGIHTFSADGKGYFSRADWSPDRGETREEQNPHIKGKDGKWKWISSGSEGRLYVNEMTGEERLVKPDERLENEESAPTVEAAQVRAQGNLALEREKQAGRERLANLTGAQKKELQDAALTLKKYGIDVRAETDLALEREKQAGYDRRNESDERQTQMRVNADLLKNNGEFVKKMGYDDAQKTEYLKGLSDKAVGEGAAKEPPAPVTAQTTAELSTFKMLSPSEYNKLSSAERVKYAKAWKEWRQAQKKSKTK